jgi:hypothetical protein
MTRERDAADVILARLHVLEAAEAIRNLKARYAELVDARYAGGAPRPPHELERLAGEIAALFCEDAVWDGGAGLGVCKGRDAIRARMAQPTLRFSRHYFVNPRIDVDGEKARARWELLAPCTLRDGKPAWMAGAEDDEYARVDGLWLHKSMALSVHFLAPHERGWSRPDKTEKS